MRLCRWVFGWLCARRAAARAVLHDDRDLAAAVIETTASLVVVLDPEGRIVRFNRACEAATGYAAGEIIGRSYTHLLPDDERPTIEGVFRRLALGDFPSTHENRWKAKDGTCRLYAWSNTAIPDGKGGVRYVVATGIDVTEQRRAEDALRRSEAEARQLAELLSRLIERLPVFITIYDPRLRSFRFNDEFRRVLGWTEEDARDGDLMTLAYPDPEVRRQAAAHMATVAPGWREFPVTARDRAVIPSAWANFRLADDTQVGIGIDLRERKRAEAALQEADRRKTEFLAVLSHELRNPLAPIRNSLHLLERATPGGAQAQRALAVIDRQVAHMTRLIEDLLDVTRISRGKIRLRREPCRLDEIVRGAGEDFREMFRRGDVAFEVVVQDRPVHALADRTRIAQVIGNLLQNAAKFTPPGGHARLSLRAGAGGQAVIEVRDDGAGLSPELIERLFEPFTQAEQTLDRSDGGLGLGLALVKGLVELHHGSVTVSSDGMGRGAVFTVRLPIEAEPAAGVTPPAAAPAGRRLRVLIIEGNADAAVTLRDILELEGHEVEIALDGDDGLRKARAIRPHAVLCDIGLPGRDGYDVARALRAAPDLRSTWLVALSGYAQPEDVERSRDAGFDRHIAKPPRIDALLQTVAEAAQP